MAGVWEIEHPHQNARRAHHGLHMPEARPAYHDHIETEIAIELGSLFLSRPICVCPLYFRESADGTVQVH
jgi:hypothetical protein